MSTDVHQLLSATERIAGLPIVFHDLLGRSGLPYSMRFLVSPPCRQVRQEHDTSCVLFDYVQTHREVARLPQGRVQVCAHGFTEIVVPVFTEGELSGILFGGPTWAADTPPPHPELTVAPDEAWLADRHLILLAVARQLGAMLASAKPPPPSSRREKILSLLTHRMHTPLGLADAAAALGVSKSRACRVVRELFGKPFARLLLHVRLERAAYLLSTTDLTVQQVALVVGIPDASYFARTFRRHEGMTPTTYRRTHQTDTDTAS
jgi:AraC-like DNA-binding protein